MDSVRIPGSPSPFALGGRRRRSGLGHQPVRDPGARGQSAVGVDGRCGLFGGRVAVARAPAFRHGCGSAHPTAGLRYPQRSGRSDGIPRGPVAMAAVGDPGAFDELRPGVGQRRNRDGRARVFGGGPRGECGSDDRAGGRCGNRTAEAVDDPVVGRGYGCAGAASGVRKGAGADGSYGG